MSLPSFLTMLLGRRQRQASRISHYPQIEHPEWWKRVSIHDSTLLKCRFGDTINLLKQAGISGIGLSRDKLSDDSRDHLVRNLMESPVQVSSLGVVGGFTNYNGFRYQDAIEDGLDAIELAEQIHAPVLRVISGPIAGHLRKHARRLVIDGLRELLPMARACGVRLALQPMSAIHREWSFLRSLEVATGILHEVNSPWVGLALGTAHLGTEKRLLDRLSCIAPMIATVQISDWVPTTQDADGRLPGRGRLPLSEIISVIESQGYRGWYELEVWSRDLWKLDAETLMRECLQSLSCLSPVAPALVPVS